MATRRRPRQCPRCGRMNPAQARECADCFAPLVRSPFRMNRKRVQYIHALARQKGLIVYRQGEVDDELYRLRLEHVGVTTSKDLKRRSYVQLVRDMKALPDAPGYGSRAA